MEIPFVDLRAQYSAIKGEVNGAIGAILEDCHYIGGENLAQFEREYAVYCQAEWAIGVANGTDALVLALRALGAGTGDEILVPANTFIATAAAVELVGARPVFVDIDPETYTLDPALAEEAVTARTRGIIPVHLYGQPADMVPLMEIAERHNLFVVEDAAQAHGAEYLGRRIGSIGHMATFSFYPAKNLGAYGDGGAITTSNPELVGRVRELGDHGRTTKYEHARVGHNSRLDALQAAVLSVKLRYLDHWNRQRQQVATWYEEALAGTLVQTPLVRSGSTHVYHLYVVETPEREAIQRRLAECGIATGIHYPLPLHLQPAFRHLGYGTGDMPCAETAAARILSLPMFPEMTREQVRHVADVLRTSGSAGLDRSVLAPHASSPDLFSGRLAAS